METPIRHKWMALIVAALATLAGAAVTMTPAAANAANGQLQCGDTITTDVVLHKDLVRCSQVGLVIGANGITLNLNGHTIGGDGRSCTDRQVDNGRICYSGVLDEGHNGLTVMHGTLRGFSYAGLDVGGHGVRVRDVASGNNGRHGFVLRDCARCLVRNSSGIGSGAGKGVWVFGGDHDRVLHNTLRQNGESGVELLDSSHDLVEGNRLSGNRRFGIVLSDVDRNQVRGNRAIGGGIGVYVTGSRNVIAENRISHVHSKKSAPEGAGIQIDGGDHNVLAGNSVRHTDGNAIKVGYGLAVGNVVRRNHIRGAGADGVQVDNKAKHTYLGFNHAFAAKDDGLDVNNPKTKLTRNEAKRNGDLGIEAVRGVTDGGGNIARHNGDSRQCVRVSCSR